MVNIKVCGMTNLDDCLMAVDLGVDYIGFVFYRESPRRVTPEAVRAINERLRGRIKTVGVFVEETDEEIDRLMDFCGLDYAQIYTGRTGRSRIPVYTVADSVPDVADSGLVLFDSYSRGYGGSGRSFDIRLVTGHSALGRAFIAGGIDEASAENVVSLRPYGVDLVSSVEEFRGKKDPAKMKRLVNIIRRYDI